MVVVSVLWCFCWWYNGWSDVMMMLMGCCYGLTWQYMMLYIYIVFMIYIYMYTFWYIHIVFMIYIYITVPRMNLLCFFSPMVAETVVVFWCEKPRPCPKLNGPSIGWRSSAVSPWFTTWTTLEELNGFWTYFPTEGTCLNRFFFRNLMNGWCNFRVVKTVKIFQVKPLEKTQGGVPDPVVWGRSSPGVWPWVYPALHLSC